MWEVVVAGRKRGPEEPGRNDDATSNPKAGTNYDKRHTESGNRRGRGMGRGARMGSLNGLKEVWREGEPVGEKRGRGNPGGGKTPSVTESGHRHQTPRHRHIQFSRRATLQTRDCPSHTP